MLLVEIYRFASTPFIQRTSFGHKSRLHVHETGAFPALSVFGVKLVAVCSTNSTPVFKLFFRYQHRPPMKYSPEKSRKRAKRIWELHFNFLQHSFGKSGFGSGGLSTQTEAGVHSASTEQH